MPNFEFNHFTGRLKNSTKLQPLYPIAPHPLESADPPRIVWDSIKTKPAKVQMSTPARRVPGDGSTLPPRLAAKMKHFQQPGWRSKPVYLMGGTMDKVLFGISLSVLAYCTYDTACFLARWIDKK